MKLKIRVSSLRILTAALALTLILVGGFAKWGLGTLCSFNLVGIPAACPLGFLQISLASRRIPLADLAGVGLVVLATLLFGRFFCAWLCPARLIKWLFKRRVPAANGAPIRTRRETAQPGPLAVSPTSTVLADPSDAAGLANKTTHSAHNPPSSAISFGVLGGALLSSLIFGFPVFCLVCPVGLTFGTILAVKRLLFGRQPSLELLLLPLFLIVELLVMRSWCSTLCPLGALLKLISNTRLKLIKPRVDPVKCFQEQGINCQVCTRDCPENVNLRAEPPPLISNCTNCLECWQKCPTQAIKLTGIRR